MKQKVITKELDLNGRKLILETGKLAQLADAAVLATWGDTIVLVTVATKPLAVSIGYFPLSVEYVEKYYAGGRITGQKFIKKETRPTEKAVLSGRAIDRSIRPLFPKDFHNEVQVIINVLSYDGLNDPVTLGLIGTSAALSISTIPWAGPLGPTRVGMKGEDVIINPLLTEIEGLDLDLMVASTATKVAMIEAEAKQIADDLIFKAIEKGHEASQAVLGLIEEFAKEAAKPKATYIPAVAEIDPTILQDVKKVAHERISTALFDKEHAWHEATGDLIKNELVTKFSESLNSLSVGEIFDQVCKEIMNDTILNKGKRVDGRTMEEVREIEIETDLLHRAHGSAVFKRGDSQVLSVTTLGPLSLSQTLEGMEGESHKRFMHHYNMGINPFSVGEVKRITGPSRRDIGHGDLVERSLENVLPSTEKFPYAIRVVSEVLAANASTSQASVCAASLALLNAGVEIEPVAGIALGLLTDHDDVSKFQVITDMRAVEDFYGEMDFKVAGTKNGVTAIQMDTKLHGLTFEIIKEALRQGKLAREVILAKMNTALPKAGGISKYAPKIEVTHIKPEEIGMLIGPGGKNINGIIARTGAQIDIEDDGTVMVSSMDQEAIEAALSAIEGMFKKVQVGEIYEGKVVRIAPFGAFVEILPGKDGLVHVSQMAAQRVEKPEDVVSEGQMVKTRVIDVDSQGKIALSMLFGADAAARDARGDSRPSSGGFDRDHGPRRDNSAPRDPSKRRPFGNKDRSSGGSGRGGGGWGR
ncbi:polyribonucleotide nucleotidyltransferase [Candidatus Daviesbacteria bacterium RIFCSPHIGHO2_12_FULL_47_45]|nr:MAG: polyribonucleotide nucleotidyltransferase [Candidatus Daviesbacteria bacterium RIFCSPHIGHO2_12_FULL_47_45]